LSQLQWLIDEIKKHSLKSQQHTAICRWHEHDHEAQDHFHNSTLQSADGMNTTTKHKITFTTAHCNLPMA